MMITDEDEESKMSIISSQPLQRKFTNSFDLTRVYHSMDKYYHFRFSKVFDKIFSELSEAPIKLRPSSVNTQVTELTIEEFDKISDE